MKKLLAVLFIASLAVGSVFAAETTLSLAGAVAQKLTIETTGTTNTELTLDDTGAIAETKLATFKVVSNLKAWHITLASSNTTNPWSLAPIGAVGGTEAHLPYNLKIVLSADLEGNVTNNLSTFGIPDAEDFPIDSNTHRTKKIGETFDLKFVTVPSGDASYVYDNTYSYEDTITISIIAG